MSDPAGLVWRHERKFLLNHVDEANLLRVVRAHPAHFRECYPSRQVNNLYLDTPGRDSYRETIEGVAARSKYRLRWYGELFGEIARPRFEHKLKRGLVGAKQTAPLPGFRIEPGARLPDPRRLLASVELPDALRAALLFVEPALVNRYSRRYFESGDGALHITLDREIAFRATRCGRLGHRWHDRGTTVLELKYALDADDAAREAAQALPFRATKSSKYARGIEGLARGVASA